MHMLLLFIQIKYAIKEVSLQRSLFHFPVFIFINFFSGVLQLHSDKLLMPFHLCIDAKSFRLKAMQVRVRRYSDSEKHLLKSSQ